MDSLGLERKQYIPSRSNAGRFGVPGFQALVLGLLLVVATFAVYYPVDGHDFVNYDDDRCVTDNVHVKYGLDWDGVKWAFTTFYFANWTPLSWISHALDCQFFGLNPGRHHDTNLALHVLNAVLLFGVLFKATGYMGRSFMVAALFALHPINVESVAWVAERRNTLSMLFLLLALGAYRWYALKPRVGRYLAVAVLFAMGLMAKPQVITLPFVLLLWDYWPLGRMFASPQKSASAELIPARSFSSLVVEKLPLFAIAAADAVVTMKAQGAGGGINPGVSLSLRLGNAAFSYLRYVGKFFWPTRLANLYPLLGNSLKFWQVFTAFVFLLVITLLVVAARHRRYLLVGWLWFLGTLVPMTGLVQLGRHAMADRYAYLPFIGLFIMICWGVADWYAEAIPRLVHAVERAFRPALASPFKNPGALAPQNRDPSCRRVETQLPSEGSPGRGAEAPLYPAYWMAAACISVLLVLGIVAHRQVSYWKNSETLWTHTLQVTSGNYQAEDSLATALMERGQYAMALGHLRKAEAIDSSYPFTPFHIGACEQQLGHLAGAVEQYKKVIQRTDGNAELFIQLRHDAFQNMSVAYHDLGDTAKAWETREIANDLQRRYSW